MTSLVLAGTNYGNVARLIMGCQNLSLIEGQRVRRHHCSRENVGTRPEAFPAWVVDRIYMCHYYRFGIWRSCDIINIDTLTPQLVISN